MKHAQGRIAMHTGTDGAVLYNADGTIADIPIDLIEWEGNAIHMKAIWNAAEGMTTEQAVRYLEHGAEMVKTMETLMNTLQLASNGEWDNTVVKDLIAKMEGK
jgi:hypothetical protein